MSASFTAVDRDLRDLITQKLAQRGIQVSRVLTLDVSAGGEVIVRGKVHSYYQRQLIVHSIRLVPGVRDVHDSLDVVTPSDARSVCPPRIIRSRWRQIASAASFLVTLIMLS